MICLIYTHSIPLYTSCAEIKKKHKKFCKKKKKIRKHCETFCLVFLNIYTKAYIL